MINDSRYVVGIIILLSASLAAGVFLRAMGAG
jgi:hypothetical protein